MLENAYHDITFSYQFLSPRLCDSREFLRNHNTAARSVRFVKPKERSSICCTPTWSRESWNFAAHLSKKWLRYSEENSRWKYQTKCHRQQRYMHRRRSPSRVAFIIPKEYTRFAAVSPAPPATVKRTINFPSLLSLSLLSRARPFSFSFCIIHFISRQVPSYYYAWYTVLWFSISRYLQFSRPWRDCDCTYVNEQKEKHFKYIISSADSLQWLPK